jgi:hypothetical protein
LCPSAERERHPAGNGGDGSRERTGTEPAHPHPPDCIMMLQPRAKRDRMPRCIRRAQAERTRSDLTRRYVGFRCMAEGGLKKRRIDLEPVALLEASANRPINPLAVWAQAPGWDRSAEHPTAAERAASYPAESSGPEPGLAACQTVQPVRPVEPRRSSVPLDRGSDCIRRRVFRRMRALPMSESDS